MTPEQLLENFRLRGIRLALDGGDLAYDGGGELTAADLELLRRHKPRLLELLTPPAPASRPQLHPKRPIRASPTSARASTRVAIVGVPRPAPRSVDDDPDDNRDEQVPGDTWIEPDPRRQVAAQTAPRDGTGRFLPRRRQQTAEQLLAELEKAGLWVWQRDGRLKVDVVEGRELSREEWRRLQQVVDDHEAELLAVAPPGRGWSDRLLYGDGPGRRPLPQEPDDRHPNLIC